MLRCSAFVRLQQRNRAQAQRITSITLTDARSIVAAAWGSDAIRASRPAGAELDKAREATMTVSVILTTKSREVVTVEPNITLKSAVALLAAKRIGALLILGVDNRVAGILSERDIVRALAERGASALYEPVSQVMTRKVSTCTESETISAIMERMTDGKFRHVPVVDQGRLVGIVSIGDVVKHRLQEMERDSAALRDYILTA
jgi:CBS domain-containing protein